MKCYVDITTDDNQWREFIVATDIETTTKTLTKSMIEDKPIVLEDDYGAIYIINCKHILNIKVKRIGGK